MQVVQCRIDKRGGVETVFAFLQQFNAAEKAVVDLREGLSDCYGELGIGLRPESTRKPQERPPDIPHQCPAETGKESPEHDGADGHREMKSVFENERKRRPSEQQEENCEASLQELYCPLSSAKRGQAPANISVYQFNRNHRPL
jgi:hypothetical protein